MKAKSRIKRLQKKFDGYKLSWKAILVYEGEGETCESKYQEYLDQGGDPDLEIVFIIYRTPGGNYPDFLKRPDGNK